MPPDPNALSVHDVTGVPIVRSPYSNPALAIPKTTDTKDWILSRNLIR